MRKKQSARVVIRCTRRPKEASLILSNCCSTREPSRNTGSILPATPFSRAAASEDSASALFLWRNDGTAGVCCGPSDRRHRRGSQTPAIKANDVLPYGWDDNGSEELALQIMRLAIRYGARFEHASEWNLRWTALKYPNVYRLLQEHGANPDLSLLGIAGDMRRRYKDAEGQLRVIAFLVEECGANVNYRNEEGMTPLAAAASEGYQDIVEYLLAKGADPNLDVPDWAKPLVSRSIAATPMSQTCCVNTPRRTCVGPMRFRSPPGKRAAWNRAGPGRFATSRRHVARRRTAPLQSRLSRRVSISERSRPQVYLIPRTPFRHAPQACKGPRSLRSPSAPTTSLRLGGFSPSLFCALRRSVGVTGGIRLHGTQTDVHCVYLATRFCTIIRRPPQGSIRTNLFQ